LQLTRGVLVSNVKTEYFYFLDSDDYITNDCIESLVSCLKNDTEIVVSGRYIEKKGKIWEDKKFRNKNFDRQKWIKLHLTYCEDQVWNILFKTSFYKSLNFPLIKADYQEDTAFYSALLLKVKNIAFCNKPTIFWYHSMNSMSRNIKSFEKQLKISNNVYDNFVNSINYINKNSSNIQLNKKIIFVLTSNAWYAVAIMPRKIRSEHRNKIKTFLKNNNIKLHLVKMLWWAIRTCLYKAMLYR